MRKFGAMERALLDTPPLFSGFAELPQPAPRLQKRVRVVRLER